MTDVTIPEDYLPIVDGLLWKKILKEGSGDSPTIKSNVNGTLFIQRIALEQYRHASATDLVALFLRSLLDFCPLKKTMTIQKKTQFRREKVLKTRRTNAFFFPFMIFFLN